MSTILDNSPFKEIIGQAIEELKGDVDVGDVVGSLDNTISFELVAIEGDTAVMRNNAGTVRYPVAEIFDVNKVLRRCRELLEI